MPKNIECKKNNHITVLSQKFVFWFETLTI